MQLHADRAGYRPAYGKVLDKVSEEYGKESGGASGVDSSMYQSGNDMRPFSTRGILLMFLLIVTSCISPLIMKDKVGSWVYYLIPALASALAAGILGYESSDGRGRVSVPLKAVCILLFFYILALMCAAVYGRLFSDYSLSATMLEVHSYVTVLPVMVISVLMAFILTGSLGPGMTEGPLLVIYIILAAVLSHGDLMPGILRSVVSPFIQKTEEPVTGFMVKSLGMTLFMIMGAARRRHRWEFPYEDKDTQFDKNLILFSIAVSLLIIETASSMNTIRSHNLYLMLIPAVRYFVGLRSVFHIRRYKPVTRRGIRKTFNRDTFVPVDFIEVE